MHSWKYVKCADILLYDYSVFVFISMLRNIKSKFNFGPDNATVNVPIFLMKIHCSLAAGVDM